MKQRLLPAAILGLIALALVVGFVVLAVLAWLAGWLLRLVLPLSLFEGMLLGLLLLVVSGGVILRFIGSILPEPLTPGPEDFDAFDRQDEDLHPIPATRFFASAGERTWEAWLRYEMANEVFVELEDSPQKPATLNDMQRQELAIRLAEVGIAILKRKSPRSPNLSVSASALKRELQRMGQQAYDSDILAAAADGINATIDFYAMDVAELVEMKHWQSPARFSRHG